MKIHLTVQLKKSNYYFESSSRQKEYYCKEQSKFLIKLSNFPVILIHGLFDN